MSKRRIFSMPPFLNVYNDETLHGDILDTSIYGFNSATWYGIGKCFTRPTYPSQIINSKDIKTFIDSQNLSMSTTREGRTHSLITFPLYFQSPGDATLVDAPGYGFAQVSDNMLSDWRNLTSCYFAESRKLYRTVSLIDARHGIKENDKMLWEMLEEYKRFFIVVLTKADGISDAVLKERFLEIGNEVRKLTYSSKIVFATSSK